MILDTYTIPNTTVLDPSNILNYSSYVGYSILSKLHLLFLKSVTNRVFHTWMYFYKYFIPTVKNEVDTFIIFIDHAYFYIEMVHPK